MYLLFTVGQTLSVHLEIPSMLIQEIIRLTNIIELHSVFRTYDLLK